MIDRLHALPVARQARELGISRGSVYYLPRPVPAADLVIMRRIDELHMDYPFAGSRMLRDLLGREGIKVGRLHVASLMKKMGIEAIYRRPNTSKPEPGHEIYPYLLRKLAVTRPNQVWATDITYIPMARGFVYLVAIVDWFSRRVLAWRLSITLTTDFCIEALEEALAHFGSPEIFNTDQGSQSPASPSPTSSSARGSRSAWTAGAAGGTTCSSSACGARSNTRRSICEPTARSATPGLRSAGIWRSTTPAGRTPRLTAGHPIRPTSTSRSSQRHETGTAPLINPARLFKQSEPPLCARPRALPRRVPTPSAR